MFLELLLNVVQDDAGSLYGIPIIYIFILIA